MIILAIDTSCDETAAAVTQGNTVLSNVLWSQTDIHSKWGGVVPNLAKRAHQERIDSVINKALRLAFPGFTDHRKLNTEHISAIAVTVGPGLAIALEVGVRIAKELATRYQLPLIPVNHIEGHVLSVLSQPKSQITDHKSRYLKPHSSLQNSAISLVASGKHSEIIRIKNIGNYKIIAHTIDDALGEALDKAARMLGFGYPGGPVLERMAKMGNPQKYELTVPMLGRQDELKFSYSGLKAAFWRLVEKEKPLTKEKIYDLAASFQNTAFIHIENILTTTLEIHPVEELWFGGGVSSNTELRKRIRKICKDRKVKLLLPYSKKLTGDNAAMIGVAAYYKFLRGEIVDKKDFDKIDRVPRAKVDEKFEWE
jgi:N6-L-threonylcarbamoyladenine synthase